MSLKEQLQAAVKSAMKEKQSEKLTTLRMVQASIKNKEIEVRPKELTEEDTLSVIKKMMKQSTDAVEQFTKGGRNDLVEKEKAFIEVLKTYLPEPLTEEQIQYFVKEAISELQASSVKDMGQVIKKVQEKTKGAADNKIVSQIVRASLQA